MVTLPTYSNDIEYLPVIVKRKSQVFNNYFCAHICVYEDLLDIENSTFDIFGDEDEDEDEYDFAIKSLRILNKDVSSKIFYLICGGLILIIDNDIANDFKVNKVTGATIWTQEEWRRY